MGAAVHMERGTVRTDDEVLRPARGGRRVGWAVFIVLAAIYAISPTIQNAGDTYLAGPTAASIVTSGDLDLEEFTAPRIVDDPSLIEHDGQRYDYFPWPRSLFAVPPAAALAVGDAIGVTPGPVEVADGGDRAWILSMPAAALATAGAAAVIAAVAWHLARARRREVALLVGLGTGLTTGYWSVSSRGLWQHGPGVLMMSIALYATVRLAQSDADDGPARRRAALVGFGGAAAIAMRPTFILFAGALAVWLAMYRRRGLAWAGLGALGGLGPYVLVNLFVFGALTPPYVDTNRFEWHAEYGEALLANLLSPARGALVFMPALVLGGVVGAYRWSTRGDEPELRRLAVLLAVASGALYLLVAAFPHWWAGFSYGPRFLLDLIPALAVLSVPLAERLLTSPPRKAATIVIAVVIGWSAFVNAQGALVRSAGCWNDRPVSVDDDPSRIWSLDDPLFTAGIRDVVTDPAGSLTRACLDDADEPLDVDEPVPE